MKKLLALGIAILTMTTSAFAGTSVNVKVNDKDIDAKGVIVDGRTLVPAREFCGFIHKSIMWLENPARVAIHPHSDTALETGGDVSDSVFFRIGEKNYEINGRFHEIDAAAQLMDGNAYVPLRALAELLGYNVVYVPSSNL